MTGDAAPNEPAHRCWSELLVALAVSIAFVESCTGVEIDPSQRIGQVSILATIVFRFSCFALPLVGALILAARLRGGRYFALTTRLVCAAIAGLASAMVAGGLVITLHATPYGLGGRVGDSSVLAMWARELQHHQPIPPLYPPAQIHILAWTSYAQHIDVSYAIKQFQVIGVMLLGPAAYASWRLLLRPIWALGIGVVATLPMIEAYRPYPFLSLIVFVPLALRFLQVLRHAHSYSIGRLVRGGIGFGLGLGILCLLYSGWLMWSAAGFAVTAIVVFPWRQAPRKAALLCAVSIVVFAVITARYFIGVLGEPAIQDGFKYFDSRVDPAYISMWRGDLPGVVEKLALWPPAGELGGVGVFTLLLVVGFGASIALGRSRTVVIGLCSIIIGMWLLRFWYAANMWDTNLVQLYPRTTAELLYCALLLCGHVAWFVRKRFQVDDERARSGVIGAACALLLLFAFAGSATLDRYMPRDDVRDLGNLAWRALHTPPKNQRNEARDATIEVSSSRETSPWSKAHLIDNDIQTAYSSELSPVENREEWIVLRFPGARSISRAVIEVYGQGFPVDFTIEVWNGERWVERVKQTDYAITYGTELFVWPPDRTDRIRLHVTKMGAVDSQGEMKEAYAVRIGEISLFE